MKSANKRFLFKQKQAKDTSMNRDFTRHRTISMPRDTGSADTEQQNELVSGTHQSKMRPANQLSLHKAAFQELPVP